MITPKKKKKVNIPFCQNNKAGGFYVHTIWKICCSILDQVFKLNLRHFLQLLNSNLSQILPSSYNENMLWGHGRPRMITQNHTTKSYLINLQLLSKNTKLVHIFPLGVMVKQGLWIRKSFHKIFYCTTKQPVPRSSQDSEVICRFYRIFCWVSLINSQSQ